tara:strand:+ start:154 stop:1218 length:1065 start_codon:yes stop_codon:yes gene_type:complete
MIHLVTSYFYYDINEYGYLRNSQIVYSAFTFFLGFKIYDYIWAGRPGKVVVILFFIFSALFLRHWSYAAAVLLPGMLARNSSTKKYLLIVLALYLFVYLSVILKGTAAAGTTPIAYLFFILAIGFVFLYGKAYVAAKITILSLLFVSSVSIVLVYPMIEGLLNHDFSYFSWQFRREFPIEITDANTAWRFGLWTTLIKEMFMNKIWGIGFGVPLFPTGLETKMNLNAELDPHFMYTVGAHNSFLTLLVRLGGVGMVIMCVMYWSLVASIRQNVQRWFDGNDVFRFSIFLSLLAISFQALFHVVIETPLYSSVYWVSWGLFYKALVTDDRSTSIAVTPISIKNNIHPSLNRGDVI